MVTGDMLVATLHALKQQNAVLADHPHAEAYQSLQVPAGLQDWEE